MSQTNGYEAEPRTGGKLSFSADLALALVLPFLALWRFELRGSPGWGVSLWTGWIPLASLLGLLTVAAVAGVAQSRARGFFPYWLRWVLFATGVLLLIWTLLSLGETRARPYTVAQAATETRVAAEERLVIAESKAETVRLQETIESAKAGEKLAQAIEKAKEEGVKVPRANLDSVLGPAGIDPELLDQAQRETTELMLGIAEAMESGEMPSGFDEILKEFHLDNPAVQAALISIAAPILGPAIGLSPAVTAMILHALIANGEISLGGALRVAAALGTAWVPGVGLDEAILSSSFQRNGEIARTALPIIEQAKAYGAADVVGEETLDFIAKTALEAAGADADGSGCPAAVVAKARKEAAGDAAALRTLLKNKCRDLRPDEIDAIVEGR